MLGVHSSVGTRLKKKFPALLLWHRLNHRLQLATSDAASSINGFFPMQAFFYEIYPMLSYSSKLQRQLCEILIDLQSVTKLFWTVASQPTSNTIFRELLR